MKSKIVSMIGIILIIVGIGILGVTGYKKYITYKNQAILRDNFEHNVNVKDTNSKDENQKENKDKTKSSDDVIIPNVAHYLTPLVSVVVVQYISYYCALLNGNDVDKPRNLAKSVTVE